ncbi:PREDICTED: uncharacterized protein LOC107195073 [Dufourea novaeangliae]|uniref:CHK kinase-like domain-containing protein n=1 Tax=Dufourea novaeangliae TaxID=178035 RepID=A0A154P6P3_DUFNO|nr:PREDICTED: uncharacterized protein LOC107195073 [Dufourea novaeangliae]KZC06800.1 hypothetical protein WN55_07934 [Dufourea novaeangliae]
MEVKSLRIEQHMLEEAVQQQLSTGTIKILNITSRCISARGFNFLSDLFKVSVKYRVASKNEHSKLERSTDLIIKLEPFKEFAREIVQQQDLFQIELKVLRDVLPKIADLVDHPIGPCLWYSCDNPYVFIMEDLNKQGFVMKCRQKALSFEQCCLVIQTIAKFHAGSVAVHERNPGILESFENGGIVSKKCPQNCFRMMQVSLLRIGDQLKNWTDVESCAKAAPKIIKLAESIGTKCINVYKYDSDEFCVLNHGDCWINNVMFKDTEQGKSVDVRLVDYQMSVYSSPAIDLLYFLNICPEFSVKYDNDDYFLELYLSTLKETMKSIGCKTKPPTMKELKEAIHKRRVYAVFAGVVLYLRMMANKEDIEDFTEVVKNCGGETKMDVFRNPDAVKLAKKMIPVMNERGYFD